MDEVEDAEHITIDDDDSDDDGHTVGRSSSGRSDTDGTKMKRKVADDLSRSMDKKHKTFVPASGAPLAGSDSPSAKEQRSLDTTSEARQSSGLLATLLTAQSKLKAEALEHEQTIKGYEQTIKEHEQTIKEVKAAVKERTDHAAELSRNLETKEKELTAIQKQHAKDVLKKEKDFSKEMTKKEKEHSKEMTKKDKEHNDKLKEQNDRHLQSARQSASTWTTELLNKDGKIAALESELKVLKMQMQMSASISASGAQSSAQGASPGSAQGASSGSSAEKATMQTGMTCLHAYTKIIHAVTDAYLTKAAALQQSSSTAASSPKVKIIQKNLGPQYLTERELTFKTSEDLAREGLPVLADGGWYYNDAYSGASTPIWKLISDSAVIDALNGLGTKTKKGPAQVASFSPIVGKSVQYSFGSNNYEATVSSQAAQPTQDWQIKMLFEGSFCPVPDTFCSELLNADLTGKDDVDVANGGMIASLAEMWSTFSLGFKYDAKRSQLWLKPHCLKNWLSAARNRGYEECRVLMHGMRTQKYELLSKDMAGFDISYSHNGAHGFGFYGACSDVVAKHYNDMDRKTTYPSGSAMIGLLLIKPSMSVVNGAYTHYNVSSVLGIKVPYPSGTYDAYALRDQYLWLPLGLAVAKP